MSFTNPVSLRTDAPEGVLPASVLWDMDGTLCDTEHWWAAAEFALAEKFGAEWTQDDANAMVGSDLLTAGAYLKERWQIDLSPREIVDLILESVVERALTEEILWRPGALDLLDSLNRTGVPCVLVTMSWEVFATPIIERLPRGRFDAIITGDRVSRGKPFPEPYLAGAAAAGVAAMDCVAIEDSNTGASSAEAAGCTVLTVENHVSVKPGPRRVPRPTLVGVTPYDLGAMLIAQEA